jgi:hypothetical protein
MPGANLTERQQKRFASVRAGLECDTGKTLAEWVVIGRRGQVQTSKSYPSICAPNVWLLAWGQGEDGCGVAMVLIAPATSSV